jgi:hypothetical protein
MHGLEALKDACRDTRRVRWIDDALSDIRYAVRTFRRNPGFAISAVLMLAVGIAASTGLFAVVDAVVLRPFPYVGAERIARVQLLPSSGLPQAAALTADEFIMLRQASTLDGAYIDESFIKTLAGIEFPESVWTEYYTGNALPLLGAEPVIGRVFTEADAPVGMPPRPVAVLTYRFWQRHFAGQASAIGQVLRLDGEPFHGDRCAAAGIFHERDRHRSSAADDIRLGGNVAGSRARAAGRLAGHGRSRIATVV